MSKLKVALESKGSLAIYYDPIMKVFRAAATYEEDTRRRITASGLTRQDALDKINQIIKIKALQS